uniref:Relaxin-like protein isoform 3 RLP3 n=1 Tax=Desmognathus ocoee TaxID=179530 RepID=A0A0H4ACC4_9SALA|nr:relaxin-like protein isoform 3 RLP3 [Desmognathus ocoee]
MRASLLCFFALCLLIEHSQATAVEKFCGKDLLRAVSYFCGASRWRRHLAGPAQDRLKERSLFYSGGNRDAFDSPNINFQEAEGNEDLKDTESGGSLRKRREAKDIDNRLIAYCCQVECSKESFAKFCTN